MAIQLTTGFSIGSQDLIDDRLVLSKAEMLALNENVYPVQFFCLCSDDNKIYVYNQTNIPNDTTGKFVVYVSTDGTTGASIDDDVISLDTTYSSQKIEGDFQKQNSDVLTTASKEIVGAINELDDKIGVKGIPAIEDSYEKAYRNVLEVPNGEMVTNTRMTCDVGSVQAYKVDKNYKIHYAENKVIAGHTYTLEFSGNDSVTNIECRITNYDKDPYQVICLQKENVANNGKITVPENGASIYFNVPITITDISLVDDAFPYDDIRIVVTDGTLVNSNTEVEEITVNGVATVGEYVKFTAGTPEVGSIGIYKYIDDKINDTDSTNNTTYSSNKIETDFAKKEELHTHDNKDVLDTITEEKINEWDAKSDFSGSYNDLTDTPTIPTKTSELTNDSNFITTDDIPNIIEDTQASTTKTYSSNKIETDFQKINDNTLTTDDKTIPGSINELDAEIGTKGFKTIPESYIKVYRNILEQPNGKIANGNKCTSTIGKGMLYLPKTDYVLYHIKNNDVIENNLQDGHTYTLTYNSNSNATVEYFIFDYAVDSIDIKCIAKETVTSGTKITMPTNSYWFQMNVLKTDNITNISLVDDAFPYDNIRLVVADGTVTNTNTQIAVSTVGDIASVGEYVKVIPETVGMDSTGVYKYIDDKINDTDSTNNTTYSSNKIDTLINSISVSGGDTITEDIQVYGIPDGFGYKSGDVIPKDTTTFTEALKHLLQVIVHPTYKAPTLSLSTNKSVIENNVETSITITPTFTKNHAGDITNVKLYRGSDLINEGTTVETYTDTYTPNAVFNYKCVVTYGDGVILQNNTGENDETGRILAGSIEKVSSTINVVNPYYAGVSTTNTLDEAGVLALTKKVETKGNKTISYTTSQSYMVFAYPKSYGAIKSVIDKNGFEVVSSFTSSTVSINGVDYYVFCSNQCSGSYTMLFKY